MGNLPDEIAITINPLAETIRVAETKDGVTRVKGVSSESVIRCFEQSISESKCVDSGFLPENCLAVSIAARSKRFVLSHPSLRADIVYHDTMYERFPLPRLVFGFEVASGGRIARCEVAVVADEKPTPETKLFEWPFSNVYPNGSVCTGAANTLPAHKNARTLSSLSHFVLSLPNNDHNFSRANNRPKLGYRELLDLMKDKEPSYWYEHILIPKKNATLGKFIEA